MFHKRFRILTYMTALWAFLALVATGQLHLPVTLIFLACLGLAMLRDPVVSESSSSQSLRSLHKIFSFSINKYVWAIISITMFCLALHGWFVLQEKMYSVTYFFFYLELNKLLTAKTNRDYLQIYTLTFFHMLAASVSTDSFVFGVMLLGYLYLILEVLTTFTIKRDAEAAFESDKGAKLQVNDIKPSGVDIFELPVFWHLFGRFFIKTPYWKKEYNPSKGLFRNRKPWRLEESDSSTLRSVMGMRTTASPKLIMRLVMLLTVAMIGTGIFWFIPRTANQNFFRPGLSGGGIAQRQSGFADTVEFGGVGRIQLNPAIIMRAEPVSEWDLERRPELIRIRGTALDRFSDNKWSKSPDLILSKTYNTNRREISLNNRLLTPYDQNNRIFSIRLNLEPETSGYLFLLDQPRFVTLDHEHTLEIDLISDSLKLIDPRYDKISYEITGLLEDRFVLNQLTANMDEWLENNPPEEENNSGEIISWNIEEPEKRFADSVEDLVASLRHQSESPDIRFIEEGDFWEKIQDPAVIEKNLQIVREILASNREEKKSKEIETESQRQSSRHFMNANLQFPEGLDKELFATTTREWTGDTRNPLRQALMIEQYFQQEFSYSLDNSFGNRSDHIEHFMTTARSGHCEYFATTMVLMLRSIGVPARIVNGYISDEWSDNQQRYIIRQEHAHSWVEVRSPAESGVSTWITFDPTPPDGIGSNRVSITWYHRFSSFFDDFRMIWYENVVDFNAQDQRDGFFAIMRFLRNMRQGTSVGVQGMQQFMNGNGSTEIPYQTLILIVGGFLLIATPICLILFRRQIFGMLRSDKSVNPYETPIDLKPFIDLMQDLEKTRPRMPGQTPLQYATAVAPEIPGEFDDFVPLTRAYYEARYNKEKWTVDHQHKLNALVDQWKQLRTEYRRSLKKITPAENSESTD